ncbi:pyridoxamine 5'-phosphate oxidase family protein [Rubritalea marina]|uniref:pyridoxamine 5'-phosphate oxidase family protein n=1 Tax=Rubritalea marina TaxID=361055 RepID=UPI00037FEB78|nr:pyridoxamine 5'-phosphate oxidase family protein [Rubritalea marina]
MGQQFAELDDKHIAFIERQHIFFVGTAADSGQVNISPKGGDSLRVLSPTKIAWLNFTGSGNESAAHTLLNNRMTIMLCSFDEAPKILRCYGRARAVHLNDPEWHELYAKFPANPGARQMFIQEIELVQSSCGMAVPNFEYQGDRNALDKWAEKKGPLGIEDYWLKKNQHSIDGFHTGIQQNLSRVKASNE